MIGETVKKLGGVFSKNAPTILTGFAVAGFLTTIFLAIKATPKAVQLLEREEALNGKPDIFESGKIVWKLYIPTMAVGTITIVCIVASNSINLRRNAALVSVYSITETFFKEYQEKVIETIGKNKELKIRDDIAKKQITEDPPTKEIIFTGKGEVLCYDSLSGRYFRSDIEKLRKIQNNLNQDLMTEMFKSLNCVYYEIGLPGIKLGSDVGWNVENGLIDFSFSSQLTPEGEPCLVLSYKVAPKYI